MPRDASIRILDRQIAYSGFTRVDVVIAEHDSLSGGSLRIRREVETHGDGVTVLPFDPNRCTALLIRQWRVPVAIGAPTEAFLLETIAGLVDHADEAPSEAVRREAIEEAGLQLRMPEPVGAAYAMPGLSTEKVHLFLAEADFTQDRTGAGGGLVEESEDIEVLEIALADLARMADNGEIRDMKTLALIQTLRLRRPTLFS
jgi:nudix-type nucleoside diphosphatase (YffH/AdpP family)